MKKMKGTTTGIGTHFIGEDICVCDELCPKCGKKKKPITISFGDKIMCCNG